MNWLLLLAFFVLGLIIGSFLNVVLFRYNTGRTLGGRSKCFSCKRELGVIDLIPVLSFAMSRGRCRTCKSKISWQYPAVEVVTGLLFASAAFVSTSLLEFNVFQYSMHMAYMVVVLSLLMLITVYDIRHKIIPDRFAFLFAAIAFVNLFLTFEKPGVLSLTWPSVIYIASGLILAFPFYLLWLISGGRWMGLGDAKLALGIGWLLGLGAGATAIIFGFWIGAVVSLFILLAGYISENLRGTRLFGKYKVPKLSLKSEIPFAPFLVAGLLITLFFGYNMFSLFYI